jgi:Type I restriction modification DNA specificity domain
MNETLIFRVPLSQAEGRLDPHFYQNTYKVLIERISTMPHQRLRDLCRFSKEIWDGESDFDHEFPYLEISEIDLSTAWFDTPKKIPIGDAPSRARMKIRHGDFLVSLTRPNRGAITRSEKEHPPLFIASTGFAVLRDIAIETVNPDYFFHALRSRIVLDQFEQRSSGGNYPAITEEEMGRVLIPLPASGTQEHIAGIMRQAHAQKTRLESEAKALLENVDAVLYRYWGCSSPSLPEGSLTQRIFKVAISAIDDRLDAPANWAPFDLSSTLYPSVRLHQVAAINPSTDFSNVGNDDTVSFVPMDCVDEVWGEVMEQHSRPYGESKGYTEFQEGDVLWAKITPCMQNGKSAIAQGLLRQRGFGSTEFHVFRVDAAQLDARYLLAVLRLKYLRQFAALFFGGSAGHQRVDASFFQKLAIPLPPLTVQQKIATEIEALKTQAQTLRQQAQATLDQAKQQVEKMILGESA